MRMAVSLSIGLHSIFPWKPTWLEILDVISHRQSSNARTSNHFVSIINFIERPIGDHVVQRVIRLNRIFDPTSHLGKVSFSISQGFQAGLNFKSNLPILVKIPVFDEAI